MNTLKMRLGLVALLVGVSMGAARRDWCCEALAHHCQRIFKIIGERA
jgi:hypothetical protein